MFKTKQVFLNNLSFSSPSHGSVERNVPTSAGRGKGQVLMAGSADGFIVIGI